MKGVIALAAARKLPSDRRNAPDRIAPGAGSSGAPKWAKDGNMRRMRNDSVTKITRLGPRSCNAMAHHSSAITTEMVDKAAKSDGFLTACEFPDGLG